AVPQWSCGSCLEVNPPANGKCRRCGAGIEGRGKSGSQPQPANPLKQPSLAEGQMSVATAKPYKYLRTLCILCAVAGALLLLTAVVGILFLMKGDRANGNLLIVAGIVGALMNFGIAQAGKWLLDLDARVRKIEEASGT